MTAWEKVVALADGSLMVADEEQQSVILNVPDERWTTSCDGETGQLTVWLDVRKIQEVIQPRGAFNLDPELFRTTLTRRDVQPNGLCMTVSYTTYYSAVELRALRDFLRDGTREAEKED